MSRAAAPDPGDELTRSRLLTVLLLPVLGPLTDTLLMLPAPMVAEVTPARRAIVEQVADAAREHNIDVAFVLSVMAAESSYDATALSPAGAIGLMQVMPETAEELGYDASNWQENIQAGTHYLGYLMQRYKHHKNGLQLAIAAYNAGPANVDRYNGVPPFRETRKYVKRVLANYKEMRQQPPPELAD